MTSPTPLSPRDEAREAESLQTQLERGDSAGIKEHINRLYSEHGLSELREVLNKLKTNEEKRGVSVRVEDNDSGLPDITIEGTDNQTDKRIDFNFDGDQHGMRVQRDADNRVTEFRTPEGEEYKISYGSSGNVEEITMPGPGGGSDTLRWNGTGWEVKGMPPPNVTDISTISVDQESGAVTVRSESRGETTSHPDGSVQERDTNGNLAREVDSHGTEIKYKYDGSGIPTEMRVTANDSPLTEIKNGLGERTGYEFKDADKHVERLTRQEDGSWTLQRGDNSETFPAGSRVEVQPNGDRKITRPDGSSFEGRADGTTVERDTSGRITETHGTDGNTTTYVRDERGRLVAMQVQDGLGNTVESITRGESGWQSTRRGADGEPLRVRDVQVNDRDGKVTIQMQDGSRLDRTIDGVEHQLDRRGRPIETRADQVVDRMRDANIPLTEAEEARLRADLAAVDRLPPSLRERVYNSLDRMATANTDNTTHLSPEERSELVRSVAHQVAHPEHIEQGGKNSCTMANVEMLMARNHPARYAEMVASLAVEGRYTAANGRTVEAARDSDGSLAANSDGYHVRSLSSELFQSATMDLVLPAGQDYRSYPPGSAELEPRPPGVEASTDSGERVVANPPPEGTRAERDGQTILTDADGKEWLVRSDGSAIRGFTGTSMENKERMLDTLVPGDGYMRRRISTADDLQQAYEANGGPPLNVGISLDSRVDVSGMAEGSAGTDAGNHAVTITRIEEGPDGRTYVYFENTANGTDHSYPNGQGVPIDQFARAMRHSSREALIKTRCSED